MIKIFIGICAVLSVVMIVMGGIEVMTSEIAHTKEAGKEKIMHALLGLVIALGAYALLFTINPDLLKSDFNPPSTQVKVELEERGKCEYNVYRVKNGIKTLETTVPLENELESVCTYLIGHPTPGTTREKVGNGWIKNPN